MRTIVVLGTGQSLTQADVNYCIGKADVLAVNDAWKLAPWADWMYAADVQFWGMHHEAIKRDFKGECWTQSGEAAEWYGLNRIHSFDAPGLSHDPKLIHQGGNSGYQAINLAYHFGASRIVLLGFDLYGTHFFGSHPRGLADPAQISFDYWLARFGALAEDLAWADVPVYNCSRPFVVDGVKHYSKLTCFRRADLETILEGD